LCCDKIPEKNNLKGGLIYCDSMFQRFQSTVLGSIDSGLVVRQSIMAAEACDRGYSPQSIQEAGKGRDLEQGITFKDTPPSTYFLQLCSTC
jgi:hypothetical protein